MRPGGWVLLARDDDTVVIGRRHGKFGVRTVVTLVRAGDRFEATAMGGARLSTGVPHERVQAISGVSADARSLVLDWDCGADLRGNPLLRVARILTAFTADAIHLLLVSEPAENGLMRGAGLELGTGWAAHSPLLLDEDPADRRLLTDHCIPAEQIPR